MATDEGEHFRHPFGQTDDMENLTKHWPCAVKTHFPGQQTRSGRIHIYIYVLYIYIYISGFLKYGYPPIIHFPMAFSMKETIQRAWGSPNFSETHLLTVDSENSCWPARFAVDFDFLGEAMMPWPDLNAVAFSRVSPREWEY